VRSQAWWYVARSSGIVAWFLLTLSVTWGLMLRTKILNGRPTPRWLLDLHRFLGGLSVVFVVVHLAGLVADSYTHFGPVELLVPLASSWRPAEVALGVVALYLLVAVEITSLLMRRLPRRLWRAVHMSSFAIFLLSTLHAITAGTDARSSVLILTVNAAVATVLFLTLVRLLAPGRARRRTHQGGLKVHASVD
jgi:predicted ferric reductase